MQRTHTIVKYILSLLPELIQGCVRRVPCCANHTGSLPPNHVQNRLRYDAIFCCYWRTTCKTIFYSKVLYIYIYIKKSYLSYRQVFSIMWLFNEVTVFYHVYKIHEKYLVRINNICMSFKTCLISSSLLPYISSYNT